MSEVKVLIVFVAFIAERIVRYKSMKFMIRSVLICVCIVAIVGIIELFFTWNPYFKVESDYNKIMCATIGNPLVFGAYMVIFLPLTLWFLENTKKFFRVIPFFLTFFSVIFSFSRIAWISMFCMLFIYFFRKAYFEKIKKRWFVVAVVLAVIMMPFFARPSFRAIFGHRFNISELKSMSYLERVSAYKITWNIFKDHPIMGVGFGNYPNVYGRYKIETTWPDLITPDNMYLRFLCDTGIVGTSVFFIFIIFWLHKLWRGRDNTVVWAIFCGLIGFLINQLAADLMLWAAVQFAFWMLLGFAVGTIENECKKNF